MDPINTTNQTSNTSGGAGKNTTMAILAYIGPLVAIPYFTAKDDPFVRFHIGQGLVLLVLEVASWFLIMFLWPLLVLIKFLNLAILVLAIIGIVRAYQGKEMPLPIVGGWAKHFKV